MTGLFQALGSAVVLLLLGVGCQTTPTQTFETKDNFTKTPLHARATVLDEKTVIVDARAPFAFALSHPSRALSVQWADFTEKEAPFEGYLEQDLFFHARRLARMGIGPDSDVLILGSGRAGAGEEGRLAWTLRRMGLTKVRFAALDSIRASMTNEAQPPPAEVTIWKPVPDESLEIKRADAMADIQKLKAGVVVLDVRTEKEYLQDADLFNRLNLMPKLINVPWVDFLSEQGTAHAQLEARLKSIGVEKSDLIYVIDDRGVKSAGATLILRELGFLRAANWTGGFRELDWFQKSRSSVKPKLNPKKQSR
ncbi:MAG: sulfurtransferase [Bdellovibrio sp.]|jgi:thiosulfate/3-mercaptopyruvate sulfurtransferase